MGCPFSIRVPNLFQVSREDLFCERAMDQILSMPGQAYDYVYGQHGTVGLIVVGVMIVVAVVSVLIWFDRRK